MHTATAPAGQTEAHSLPSAAGFAAAGAHLPLAETLIGQLHELLEFEFEQLKAGAVDQLDNLQNRKMVLLEQLAQVSPGPLPANRDLPPDWQPYAAKARECRMLHQRNESLVHRQLDAVRGALSALQIGGEGLIEETYDRSGRLSWGNGRRRPAGRGWREV